MPSHPEHPAPATVPGADQAPALDDTAAGAALVIDALVKTYDRGRDTVHAVNGLSLTARRGRVTALLGANGAGKTTTLQCAQGMLRPTSGSVRLLDEDPWNGSSDLRARVGVMLQDGGLPQAVRPRHLLEHLSSFYREPWPVADLTARLGIEAFAGTPVRRLSGGQQQRVALAAALIGRPEVLFLDEPSAGLDPQSRKIVFDLVAQLRDAGTCIILTTHLMDDAARLADYVYIVRSGQVAAQGTVAELVASEQDAQAVLTVTVAAGDRDRLHDGPPWQQPGFGDVAWSVKDRTVTLTGALEAGHLREITAWATAHGRLPELFSLQPRTLEDVFLEISGGQGR